MKKFVSLLVVLAASALFAAPLKVATDAAPNINCIFSAPIWGQVGVADV